VKLLKKIGAGILLALVIWAIVNPYLFTLAEDDYGSIQAFKNKGIELRFEDFSFKQANLHIARVGVLDKKVLLFVHGSPGSWVNAWDYMIDTSWYTDYEIISIDRPGFGGSDYGQAKNLFEQAEIINQFVSQNLAERKVQLIGHSYGGPLVLQLCVDADSLYEKCIIMAGSVSPLAEKEEWQLNVFSKPLLNWMVPGSFEQGIEELLWLKDDLKSPKYLNGIEKIKTPITGIYGTKDNMVPYQPNVDFLRKVFDTVQLTLHSIQDGNHFIPWDNYTEMKKIIRSN